MSIKACEHVPSEPAAPTSAVCEACVARGDSWVHLRLCLHCGHVGCCDSSKNRHASRHSAGAGHPVIQSIEPGEDWRWCNVHGRQVG